LRRLKVPEEKIAAVQEVTLDRSLFSDQELVALELADRMAEPAAYAVSDELWERLSRFFDRGEIIELVCAAGLFDYFNRVNNVLRTEITR
jgi:alkylhydroperoxidase family enzyme